MGVFASGGDAPPDGNYSGIDTSYGRSLLPKDYGYGGSPIGGTNENGSFSGNKVAGKARLEDPLSNYESPDGGASTQNFQTGLAGLAGRSAPMWGGAGHYGGESAGSASLYGGAAIDTSQDAAARLYQTGLADRLQQQSMGEGPSLGTMQLKSAQDSALAGQMAAANSGGFGGSAALGMRNIALQGAAQQGQLASQGAQIRMQEQQNAQNALAGLSGQMRAQDQGLATNQAGLYQQAGLANAAAQNQYGLANAGFRQQAGLQNQGFDQQTGLANMQSQLTSQGMTDEQSRFYTGALANQNENNRQAYENYYGSMIGQDQGERNRNVGYDQQGSQKNQQYLQSAGTAVAMGAMLFSDENLKTDVTPGDSAIDDLYSKIGAHEYAYKDERDGVGRFVSPMAQELERTAIGKSAVVETPRGKMVEYGRLMGAVLAGGALHHRRIERLEQLLEERGDRGADSLRDLL